MRLTTSSWIIDVYGVSQKKGTAEARDMLLVVGIVTGRFHLDLWQVLTEGKNDSTLLIPDAPAVSFTLGALASDYSKVSLSPYQIYQPYRLLL
jgi:hypothetical protein